MQTWALTKIEFCMWTAARPVILNFWTLPTLKNPVWHAVTATLLSEARVAAAQRGVRVARHTARCWRAAGACRIIYSGAVMRTCIPASQASAS